MKNFNIPQEAPPIVPGYYYSNVPLTKNNLDEKGKYIGTTQGTNKADNHRDHRYIYYIVSDVEEPKKIDEYYVPRDGYVYLLSSEIGTFGRSSGTQVHSPTGRISYFVKENGKAVVRYLTKNAERVWNKTFASGAIQTEVDNANLFDLREYSSSGYNESLAECIQNNSYWSDINSVWTIDQAESFNNAKNNYIYLWEIPKSLWDNAPTDSSASVADTRYQVAKWGRISMDAATTAVKQSPDIRVYLTGEAFHTAIKSGSSYKITGWYDTKHSNQDRLTALPEDNDVDINVLDTWRNLKSLTTWWRWIINAYIRSTSDGPSTIRRYKEDIGWTGSWKDIRIDCNRFNILLGAQGQTTGMAAPNAGMFNGKTYYNLTNFVFTITTKNYRTSGVISLYIGDFNVHGQENDSVHQCEVYTHNHDANTDWEESKNYTTSFSNVLPQVKITSLSAMIYSNSSRACWSVSMSGSPDIKPGNSPLRAVQLMNSGGTALSTSAGPESDQYPEWNSTPAPSSWTFDDYIEWLNVNGLPDVDEFDWPQGEDENIDES